MARGKTTAGGARSVARRARIVALVLAFLAGVGIMAYPFVSNFMYQRKADARLEELQAAVAKGDSAEYLAQIV